MAQSTQTECQPSFVAKQVCCEEAAFSPSIIEIGFIDEDDNTSDLSEFSCGEDEKVERGSSSDLVVSKSPVNVPQGEESGVNLFSTEVESQDLAFNHVPPQQVPDQEVVQIVHSNQSFISENSSDYQNALQSSETEKSDASSSSCGPSLLIDPPVSTEPEDVLVVDDSSGTAVVHDCTAMPTQQQPQTLEESMLTLQLQLEDRSTLLAFEKTDKKKPDEPMEVAKSLENVPKNRYKDVLPYDESRVVLQDGSDGDYINASFVHMSLPHPRKPNEYIATQGPLPQTCDDFWQMIWEQKCGIIVMVTTLKERNRVKCHQYWPDLYQTSSYGHIQVTCFSETNSSTGVMRDFLISNQKVNEERHVIQLQYINWPDHGVPEDSSDFLEFVQQLRDLRRDVGGIVVVHCSAGVGRTGVLILMETAMGYIDADEPIYPLEMVKEMREQRVMMVQTVVQYKFICEALLKTYNDRCKMIEDEKN